WEISAPFAASDPRSRGEECRQRSRANDPLRRSLRDLPPPGVVRRHAPCGASCFFFVLLNHRRRAADAALSQEQRQGHFILPRGEAEAEIIQGRRVEVARKSGEQLS